MKKEKRIDLRVPSELKEAAERLAENLSISRNKLIERAINNYLLDTEKFAICPTCKNPMFDIERIPINEEIEEIECSKGHLHYFDFEENKFVR